ncbi:MAG: 50S ribosomal protein L7ae-like protein [Firmicutes bacterium]|uniref:Large subunit ribosomal protein L7A n=1 Tax=Melghirimyces thermohalophilus TaxID=1236220 RepID=A0A1G6PCU2_9BACL|nr:50S ribosomal protein L7ae-like protein [Melghirimyces thermohalophilus]MDA8352132.1 50S ribosomal protein L7ae-like protein [Bacillota bacterium]SDC77983.1 large subunit ribosomal protein L7A [Melghirimyces thermohalophilus]
MSYDKVKSANTLLIGAKQTKKAIQQGKAHEIVIAEDAEPHITQSLIQLCRNHGVAVHYVDSMEKLGKACGIDVSAATAAILD